MQTEPNTSGGGVGPFKNKVIDGSAIDIIETKASKPIAINLSALGKVADKMNTTPKALMEVYQKEGVLLTFDHIGKYWEEIHAPKDIDQQG